MIRIIYKVEGDDNEYQSIQQAFVAEVISNISDVYVNDRQRLKIAQEITKQYFLSPILPESTSKEPDKELGSFVSINGGLEDPMTEVNSWGPSA